MASDDEVRNLHPLWEDWKSDHQGNHLPERDAFIRIAGVIYNQNEQRALDELKKVRTKILVNALGEERSHVILYRGIRASSLPGLADAEGAGKNVEQNTQARPVSFCKTCDAAKTHARRGKPGEGEGIVVTCRVPWPQLICADSPLLPTENSAEQEVVAWMPDGVTFTNDDIVWRGISRT